MVIYEFIQLVNFINIVKSNFKIYQKILKLFKYKNVPENIDLNYFKNSNKKELNINFSNSVHEDAKNIYSNFKKRR